MSDTKTLRKRNLPLIFLSLAPAMLLAACNTQEKQEMAAALARAEAAAQRAESAQHDAESAAARARSDKVAAANSAAAPVEDPPATQQPEVISAPGQDGQPSTGNPG